MYCLINKFALIALLLTATADLRGAMKTMETMKTH